MATRILLDAKSAFDPNENSSDHGEQYGVYRDDYATRAEYTEENFDFDDSGLPYELRHTIFCNPDWHTTNPASSLARTSIVSPNVSIPSRLVLLIFLSISSSQRGVSIKYHLMIRKSCGIFLMDNILSIIK